MSEIHAARRGSRRDSAQEWYVTEGKRGEELLKQGQADKARAVFESILTRLGKAPSYGRAVILGRLGRSFYVGGRPDVAAEHVRQAIDVAGHVAPTDASKQLRGTLGSELGDALRASGQYADARKAYEAALTIARELKDLRSQGVELARLGVLALTEGKLQDAERHYREAGRISEELGHLAAAAETWSHLADLLQNQPGRLADARQLAEKAVLLAQRLNP